MPQTRSGIGAWVLEDDYDSEFRHLGDPVPALQSLDTDGRAIHLGTFSKMLFPSLRLAYMVVPGFLLGFASLDEDAIRGSTDTLHALLAAQIGHSPARRR